MLWIAVQLPTVALPPFPVVLKYVVKSLNEYFWTYKTKKSFQGWKAEWSVWFYAHVAETKTSAVALGAHTDLTQQKHRLSSTRYGELS